MLLLNLQLHDVAGVLDDFRDVRLVSSADFPHHSLDQVDEPAPHPVLVEDARTKAERLCICLDHAESSMDGPENEEDDEEVMGVPESLKVDTLESVHRCDDHGHQCSEHDVA